MYGNLVKGIKLFEQVKQKRFISDMGPLRKFNKNIFSKTFENK